MTVDEMITKKNEYGYSNKKLAELSGVPLGTVQKIMSKSTKAPRYQSLAALEAVLKGSKSDTCDHTDTKQHSLRETSSYGYTDGTSAYSEDAWHSSDNSGKTLEDYLALPDDIRVEMIDGVFYYMSAPTSVHQLIVGEVSAQLRDFVRKNGGDCVPFIAPTDVQLDCDDKTIVEPDVFVVCDRSKITLPRIVGAPDLVIEVLSPSGWYHDMRRKLKKYKNAGVREYWIIMPDHQDVMVYRFWESDVPKDYTFANKIPVGIWEDACEIDFKAVYDLISFLYK
ncbi:MAG: Uma2 family endonuclease [Lachnospiraceae bacterium]|nr:Uma2 family endonuclease [Lachnospiraceae bacterium]